MNLDAIARVEHAVALVSLSAGSLLILGGGWATHHMHLDEAIFRQATAQGVVIENQHLQVPAAVPDAVAVWAVRPIVPLCDSRLRAAGLLLSPTTFHSARRRSE
jgi:hypothetical protein